MYVLLHFIQFAIITATASVIFEDCGSAYELHRVNILGCGASLPCYITLGDNVPVTMEFYSDFVSRKLDQDVTININFISSRTHVTPDPCATVHCPVNSHAVTSFTSVMSVPTNVALDVVKINFLCFQNQRGFLQWRVYNDEDRLVLCYSVLVQTQTPMQNFLRNYKNQQLSYNTLPVKHIRYNWKLERADEESLRKIIDYYYKNWKVK